MPGHRVYSAVHHAVVVDLRGIDAPRFFERRVDARAWITWRLKREPTEVYLTYQLSNPMAFCGAESGAIKEV